MISRLAFIATFFAFGVIALGVFTRLIDAGLSCPDWPGCYGHLTVPGAEGAGTQLVAYKAWAEMIHRYFVAGLSFLIICTVLAIAKNGLRSRMNIILAISLLLLVVYQIILGRWTVTLKLLPMIVTQHLLGGYLIISALWLLYLGNKPSTFEALALRNAPIARIKKLLPWAIVALIMLLLQILLGAWTSTHYASLSCPDFPFCTQTQSLVMHFKEAFNIVSPIGINYEGGVLAEPIRQTIQMTHRMGALILTVYLLVFSGIAMPILKHVLTLMKSLYFILGLLVLQLCLGISNVIFKLPLATAVSHNLIAVLLLLSLITLAYKLATIHTGVNKQ